MGFLPQERLLGRRVTRKQVLVAGGIAGSGLLLNACGPPSAPDRPRPVQTQLGRRELPTLVPTLETRPTLTPTERPKTIVEQAKDEVVDAWLGLFTRYQETVNGTYSSLQMERIDVTQWERAAAELRRTYRYSGPPLEARWAGGRRIYTSGFVQGFNKFVGKILFSDVRVGEQVSGATPEDKKNAGILWRGYGVISFYQQSSSLLYGRGPIRLYDGKGQGGDEAIKEWIVEPVTDPFPELYPPRPRYEEALFVFLTNRNGEWERVPVVAQLSPLIVMVPSPQAMHRCDPTACKEM